MKFQNIANKLQTIEFFVGDKVVCAKMPERGSAIISKICVENGRPLRIKAKLAYDDLVICGPVSAFEKCN